MKHMYREAYIKKLENKKISGDLQKTLDVSFIWLFSGAIDE